MEAQNYGNHRQRATLWLIAWSLAVIAIILLAIGVVRDFTLQNVGLLLLGVAVFLAIMTSRAFSLRLQDRIIRAEMRVRLDRLGRAGDLARFSARQLVALRFASDAELPALMDRALAEHLTADQIKRAVTDWQGDYQRV